MPSTSQGRNIFTRNGEKFARIAVSSYEMTLHQEEKNCLVCGSLYWGFAHSKYCGRSCRGKAYRAQKQAEKGGA
jgi:hypothetical protein